jgi:L-threonylcarbamoyladenylate synthase
MLEVLNPTQENLEKAAQLLRSGELVAIPTETVYGLAGDAFNPSALARIFEAKERPTFDPLIVHVAPTTEDPLDWLVHLEVVDLHSLSSEAKSRTRILLKTFWPGPLTIVLPKHIRIPDLATSGLSTVAVRMPAHPVAQALLRTCNTPLAAPSANRFGRISPTRPEHVVSELSSRGVAAVLDGGQCSVGVESTIVAVSTLGELTLLRPGGIAKEELEKAVGAQVHPVRETHKTYSSMPAPGMLESHYAPRKPLAWLPAPLASLSVDELNTVFGGQTHSGVLCLNQSEAPNLPGTRFTLRALSTSGSAEEAAQNLFLMLRELDASPAEMLWAEPLQVQGNKPEGLWAAIYDRLNRATVPRPLAHGINTR